MVWHVRAVHDEPTVDDVREGLKKAKAGGCDSVVAIGGGSAIDAGRTVLSVGVVCGLFGCGG